MRLNKERQSIYTHEGAKAKHINVEQALRRSFLSCLLWEREFYEDGEEIAVRIYKLAQEVKPEVAAKLAAEGRNDFNLRHAPLVILSAVCKTGAGVPHLVQDAIYSSIQRPDELAEFLAFHAKMNGVGLDKIKPILTNQMRKGLARAFKKFDEYQLAKYNRSGMIKLRDVLFLTHPKPDNEDQETLWKRLVDNNLKTPDTWETNLSAGEDKKQTFERLLKEKKLGYLALLRNLRSMVGARVDRDLIEEALADRKGASKVLPFRFTAAARACPQLEPYIDAALVENLRQKKKLAGKTIVLVDVSYSMKVSLSQKSDMTRMDAAATLASVAPMSDLRVFTFSYNIVEVPPRFGMAGVDAIINSQSHGGTDLGGAVRLANGLEHDRLIVITDEQSHSPVPDPVAEKAYMINVASNKNGVGYGKWTHIDGFSEAVLRFIQEVEWESFGQDD